jgi:addiction module HigA family antidote
MRKSRSAKLPPIHPGEILREDYMKPLQLSMNHLAMALHVPVTRIAEIVHERRSISADTAIRLARYFKTSPKFWLNLQAAYDLEVVEDRSLSQIEREVQVRQEARGSSSLGVMSAKYVPGSTGGWRT